MESRLQLHFVCHSVILILPKSQIRKRCDMSDQDLKNTFEWHDVLAAFSLLSRLPVPVDHQRAGERAANAVWAFPLVGASLGAIAGLVAVILQMFLLPSGLTAACALLTLIALSGAMHEDGLADCADGFWGGHNRARRLEIMHDSSVGAYGVVVLIIFMLAQWSAIESLLYANPILVLAGIGAVSRLPMIFAMWIMPNARNDGLSVGVGMPSTQSVQLSTTLTFLIALIAFGWAGIGVFIIALLAAVPLFVIANIKIEGQTGDVLGASQKCAEIGAFAAVLIL